MPSLSLVNILAAAKSAVATRTAALKTGASVIGVIGAGGIVTSQTPVASAPPAISVVKTPATATPTATPTPTPAATPAPIGFQLGLNVASVEYYASERTFANLATGSEWLDTGNGWQAIGSGGQDALGVVRFTAATHTLARILTPPAGVWTGRGAAIRCRWTGTGRLSVRGAQRDAFARDHQLDFFWPAGAPPENNVRVWLEMSASDASDPLSNLDCREKDAVRSDVFSSEVVASLKPYGVLRFLDWQPTNSNPASVTWATRTQGNSINQSGPGGVALEHMVALANAVGSDPWFTIPWNADEDYVTRMAQLIHDGVPGNRRVYVELGNEVWNYAFPLAHQVQAEGVAAKLGSDPFSSNLARYAQKTIWAMKIWAKVFADRPGQLVRVASTQNDNPWVGQQIMAAPGLADNVDALASAPYFSIDTAADAAKGVSQAEQMAELKGQVAVVMGRAAANQAIAKQYGKRFITYEGGQHVTDYTQDGGARVVAVNRDAAMYDIYKTYLSAWKTQIGDVMTLYKATGPISGGGAWGLREYAGQPLAETPKRRAALEFGRSSAAKGPQ